MNRDVHADQNRSVSRDEVRDVAQINMRQT